MPDFPDLAALNAWLEQHCPALMALPAAFDGFVEQSKRVSPACLITFERNRYGVPASFANLSACGSIPSGSSLRPKAISYASISG